MDSTDHCPDDDAPAALETLSDTAPVPETATSDAAPFAVVAEGRLRFANPAFRSMFRVEDEITGMSLADLIAAQSRAAVEKLLADPTESFLTFPTLAVHSEGTSFPVELHLAHRKVDGTSTIHVFPKGAPWQLAAENQLSTLAYTDALTGLPNRLLLMDRLRDAIVRARSGASHLAVLMADLDGLKGVNVTFEHQAGDVLLQVTAQRFLAIFRSNDTLARLGGDEFCILLPNVGTIGEAEAVAARLIDALREPIAIDGSEVRVGVSVGIALFPHHGLTGDALIAAADAALYEAKRNGRNRHRVASAPVGSRTLSLPLIIWTAAHDIGIETMDRQHRQIADRLNDLAASLRRGDDPAVISDRLTILLARTAQHFASEESLMAQSGYRHAAEHGKLRACLLQDLRCFSSGCDTRSLSLTLRFLQEWLLRHVATADRELAVALRSLGFC
jgi:diguanylate cyclase (GGDEF)-like protein/hemerythrin-like metal-binding protein